MPDDQLDRWTSDHPQPDTAVITQETNQQIITAIRALPVHQRETILLRYVEDLSLQEISDILHIPVGTVKSRLSIGLRLLKEAVGEGKRWGDEEMGR